MEGGAPSSEMANGAGGRTAMKWGVDKNASDNAAQALPELTIKYFHAGRKAAKGNKPPAKLHRFRVKTKNLRYALELFRPIYGAALEPRLESLQEIQKLLGQVSDLYTTRALLKGERTLKKKLEREAAKKIDDFRAYWKK